MRRYYSDRGQCAKCYLSCKTCSGPRRDQCVTCPRGWQLAAGECHPECPEGFFKSNFGCQKCHHYCRTCKGKVNVASQTLKARHVSNTQMHRRWRSSGMHFLSTALYARRWFMHGVPWRAILWSSDATLQELSRWLPKMYRPWEVQLRRLLAAITSGQVKQSVRTLLHGQRERITD